MNRTHAENEIAAHIEGNTMAAGLHAALADQEAELDRMRYLLKEAVDTLRYISQRRGRIATAVGLAEAVIGAADDWLGEHAVEADNLTGA
jgi:hypothetical protein